MSAEEILKSSERSALNNNQFVSRVSGKKSNTKSSKKLKSLGAVGFIAAMAIIALVFLGSGNILPAAVQERMIEATDVQCADMVMSKNIAIQQALTEGELPDDTTKILNEKGIQVGYINESGEFVENNKAGVSLVLKKDSNIIEAKDYVDKILNDASLYNNVNDATYGCAAYYYDESANEVFENLGTKRNNFTSDSDFDEVVNSLMGEGSNIDVNTVSLVEKEQTNQETGVTEIYYEYEENGTAAKSGSEAADFINAVGAKNYAANTNTATLNSADSLKAADTVSKEQRDGLLFSLFMENVSKMKAGDGNEAKVNEMMNFLYDKSETEVVDVKTGEVVKVTGSALEAPSLYAMLSGDRVNLNEAENYSADRILKTVENRLSDSNATINETVTSSTNQTEGSIGRLISDGVEAASNVILSIVEPTVSRSLVDNSFDNTKGVAAGEALANGAVVVERELAKGSGATAGDGEAIKQFGRLYSKIAALNAEADRLNRSPFDITSKNTFLGSIVYNFAMTSMKFSGVFSGIKTFSSAASSAVMAILPTSFADDTDGYLATFGDCETLATIGAVGTAQCSAIATFDTSTLNNPFNDAGFVDFVNNNTTLDSSGVRKINEGSDLADFILYNNKRETPAGLMDGGILDSISNESSSIPFISDIAAMIEMFVGASEQDKKFASGEAFVNSSSNPDWQTYKYAQRYVSLARATAALRQYSSDETAYNNMKFFEGSENPVVAFIKSHNILANK